jgi:hydroxymethylglutaryl-CoA lyase
VSHAPASAHIIEVGPRDGLQNEARVVPVAARVAFIEALVAAGLREVEVGSFVHPKLVPTMAETDEVFRALRRVPGVRLLALVANARGYERALAAGCEAIALFTAATEGFAKANIHMGVRESMTVFADLARRARADGLAVRGYVSTVIACPYDGPTAPEAVAPLVEELLDLGCYEVSLGDTIGVATPGHVERLGEALLARLPADRLVWHFHDTWGMGAANATRALDLGFRRFDASAGGLGGCPFAGSASGNLATEDLVYLLGGLGYATGVDLDGVARASEALTAHLGHGLESRVHRALTGQRLRQARSGA